MIDPLYGGKSAHDVLQALLDDPDTLALRRGAQDLAGDITAGRFRSGWRKALHDGWVEGTAFQRRRRFPPRSATGSHRTASAQMGPSRSSSVPIPRSTTAAIANIGWLQELPKPVTNLSWDNAALMSIRTMAKLSLAEQDVDRDRARTAARYGSGADGSGPSRRLRSRCIWAMAASRRAAWAGGLGFNAYASAPPTRCCSLPAQP